MTFSITKPDSGPSPQIDVDQIRDNFSEFSTKFSVNHTGLDTRNPGNHKQVIFEEKSLIPEVTGTYSTIYAKSVTNNAGTSPQLFCRLPVFLPTEDDTRGSGNDPMQLTYNTVNTAGPQYQSFLAGGFVVYSGQTTDITIPIVLSPAPTSIVVAIASAHNMTTSSVVPYDVWVTPISSSSFKIESKLNGTGPVQPYLFTWIAIGAQ
jgi:hypothetical protein